MLTFDVQFSFSENMKMEFHEETSSFNFVLDSKYDAPPVDYYEGDYEVTPKADKEQILATQHKFMIEDVTVKKVPYFQTSNEYGETVYIASEV